MEKDVGVGSEESMVSPYSLLLNRSKKEQKNIAFHEYYGKLVKNTDTSYWENWK